MSLSKITFGGIAFFAIFTAFAIFGTLYNCDDICEFSEIFRDSNLAMSATGKLPKWSDDIDLCIYGDDINDSTLAIFSEAIHFYTTVSTKDIKTYQHTDVSMCPLNTQIYILVVTGRVTRSTVSGNYENIMERENLVIPNELPRIFYESAFAQTGFLADTNKVSVAILINQISQVNDETAIQYISSGIYEELFHAIAIASDLTAQKDIRSVLQEKYIHTPSISSGIYSAQEAQKYLAARPHYLCTFDIMHLLLLYDSGVDGLEIPDYIDYVESNFDDLKSKALSVYENAASESNGLLASLMC